MMVEQAGWAKEPVLRERATSSLEPQPAREDCLHLPATRLEERLLLLSFFFLFSTERMVAKAEGYSHTIDLADAHAQIKLLLQFHLNGGTGCVRSLLKKWWRETLFRCELRAVFAD